MPREPLAEIEKKVRALRAKLNKPEKRGGENRQVIVPASEAPNVYFLRRPSGIMSLDLDTAGGIPAGGLVYLSGPDGGGKTTLLYKYFAMLQRLYGKKARIAYGLSEAAPDHLRMRGLGVQVAVPDSTIEAMNQARKERGEAPLSKEEEKELKTEVGGIEIIRERSAERFLDVIVDAVESKAFDIVAADSISALMPENEAGKDLDENPQMAAAAQALTRFFLHYLPNTTGFNGVNETTVFFISQVRSNKKKSEAQAHMQKYMKDWAAQGAWAAKHGKLIDICVWGGSKEKEAQKVTGALGEESRDVRVAISKTIHWEILKGKAGTHDGVTGEVEMSFQQPYFDDQRGILVAGLRRGVIRERDGLITVVRHGTGEVIEPLNNIAGADRFCDLLRSDFEVELQVRREVLAASGIQCLYR